MRCASAVDTWAHKLISKRIHYTGSGERLMPCLIPANKGKGPTITKQHRVE